MKKIVILTYILFTTLCVCAAQELPQHPKLAVKTNMLYDVLLTPNVGIEYAINNKYSVAANWMYAWWNEDADKWYHRVYGGDIEARKWLGDKPFRNSEEITPFKGWHIGVYGQMVKYDFEWGNKGALTEKWSYGGGIAAGWSKALGKKLSLDFTLGVGYLWGEYKEYLPIDECYVWQATKIRRWIGPTKAEVQLVWLLGK